MHGRDVQFAAIGRANGAGVVSETRRQARPRPQPIQLNIN
jgi:hypothetical protein